MSRKPAHLLRGIIPVLNTPFDNELRIDFASLERLIERGLVDGISGCLVPVVASEVAKLSIGERKCLVAEAVAISAGRIPVIAGVSSQHPGECEQLARHAVASGCDGILCQVPPSRRQNDAAAYDFFVRLAGTGAQTLVIQDLDWAGYGMSLDLILRLFERIPSFTCVKIETVPAGAKYTEVLRCTGGRLGVMAGWALPQMIEALDRGVNAFNTTAINKPFARIHNLYRSGRRDEAVELFERVLPYLAWSHQHLDVSIQFLKRYCCKRGLFATELVRPPALPYDEYHVRCGDELIGKIIALEDELDRLQTGAAEPGGTAAVAEEDSG